MCKVRINTSNLIAMMLLHRVNNKMGFGFIESVYEKCLLIELCNAGLIFNFGERKVEIKLKIKDLR